MMRRLAMLSVVLLVTTSFAFELGPTAPAKPAVHSVPPAPDPARLRQGGDTFNTAVAITGLPFITTGSTAGYTDDYDEVCPYDGSTSPDVVYSISFPTDEFIGMDTFGSDYDTKIYVYDDQMNLVACNDDHYPDYTSRLELVPCIGGVTYYLIVDGYGGASGDYELLVFDDGLHCLIDCPPGAVLEGEPPLVDGYVDNYNGGCDSPGGDNPVQAVTGDLFCGLSGWYVTDCTDMRDNDWLEILIGDSGVVEITGDAEIATHLYELANADCDDVGVVQNVTIGPCIPGTMILTGEPGSTVWIWVGPTIWENPGWVIDGYVYLLELSGGTVRTESRSWSTVKGLFE